MLIIYYCVLPGFVRDVEDVDEPGGLEVPGLAGESDGILAAVLPPVRLMVQHFRTMGAIQLFAF